MSYDVWVDSFRKDASVSISKDALRKIFGSFVTEVDPTFWRVRYDESNRSDIYLSLDAGDPNKISGLSVNRPCADDRLWKSLTQVLRSAPFAFYAPDGPPVIADDTVIAHLPEGMIEALGEPIRLSAGGAVAEGGYSWAPPLNGGFAVLELPSRDAAVAWAARIAKACRCQQELRVFGFDPTS